MGLDMMLYKTLQDFGDVATPEQDTFEAWDDLYSKFIEVGYWRKENHIHNWFVENVQDGVDKCHIHKVSVEALKELKNTCLEVLEDHDLSESYLPTSDGFFFGSTSYDEEYFEGIEETVEIVDNCLEMFSKNPELKFYYHSSW